MDMKASFPVRARCVALVFLAAALAASSPRLRAGESVFNGGKESQPLDLKISGHWSGGKVPTPGSDLVIHNEGFLQAATWQAASLRLDKARLFLKKTTLDVTGDMTLRDSTITLRSGGILRGGGTIEISHDSHLIFSGSNPKIEAGSVFFSVVFTLRYLIYTRYDGRHDPESGMLLFAIGSDIRLTGKLVFHEAARIEIFLARTFGGTFRPGNYLLATASSIEGPLPQAKFFEIGEDNVPRPLELKGIIEATGNQLVLKMP